MSIISNIRGAECVICALFYDCRGVYGIKPASSVIYGQSTVKSRLFRRIFAVILTDNGSEFKHTRELETAEVCKKRTKVFYCEPQASRQKP